MYEVYVDISYIEIQNEMWSPFLEQMQKQRRGSCDGKDTKRRRCCTHVTMSSATEVGSIFAKMTTVLEKALILLFPTSNT